MIFPPLVFNLRWFSNFTNIRLLWLAMLSHLVYLYFWYFQIYKMFWEQGCQTQLFSREINAVRKFGLLEHTQKLVKREWIVINFVLISIWGLQKLCWRAFLDWKPLSKNVSCIFCLKRSTAHHKKVHHIFLQIKLENFSNETKSKKNEKFSVNCL